MLTAKAAYKQPQCSVLMCVRNRAIFFTREANCEFGSRKNYRAVLEFWRERGFYIHYQPTDFSAKKVPSF